MCPPRPGPAQQSPEDYCALGDSDVLDQGFIVVASAFLSLQLHFQGQSF